MHKNPQSAEIRHILETARTVAVVGLSQNPHRTSHRIASILQGFGLRIFPVNPTLKGPVLGERPYSSVEELAGDLGEPPDIVDVFRRSKLVPPVARDTVAAGVKVLWMQQGVVNEEAARFAEGHGLTVVMDRCIKVDYTALVVR